MSINFEWYKIATRSVPWRALLWRSPWRTTRNGQRRLQPAPTVLKGSEYSFDWQSKARIHFCRLWCRQWLALTTWWGVCEARIIQVSPLSVLLLLAKRSGKSRVYTWFNSRILSCQCSWASCQSSEKSFTCKFTCRRRSFSSFITGLECVRHFLLFLWLGSHHEGYVSLLLPDRDYPPTYKIFANGFMIFLNTTSVCHYLKEIMVDTWNFYAKFISWWNNLLSKVRTFLFFLFSYWEGYSISDQLLKVDE